MDQRLSILTLGVHDLAAMREFYESKFGWTPVAANKDIVFFKLNGCLFSLFGKESLALDANMPDDRGGAMACSFAYLVPTEAEVDVLFELLERRGVTIVKRPQKTFFGTYTGHVADIEGNLWDIGYNPYIELDAHGNVMTHKDIQHLE